MYVLQNSSEANIYALNNHVIYSYHIYRMETIALENPGVWKKLMKVN